MSLPASRGSLMVAPCCLLPSDDSVLFELVSSVHFIRVPYSVADAQSGMLDSL